MVLTETRLTVRGATSSVIVFMIEREILVRGVPRESFRKLFRPNGAPFFVEVVNENGDSIRRFFNAEESFR